MVSYIPKGYGCIHFVADCYFENSIEASERLKCGISNKVIVKSSKSKITIDFSSSFLLCGEKTKQDNKAYFSNHGGQKR